MLFWKKRNRRQPRKDEPSLLERTDWRAVGNAAGLVALGAVLAVLLVLALDRPVHRVIIEGSFQRVARELGSIAEAMRVAGLVGMFGFPEVLEPRGQDIVVAVGLLDRARRIGF